MNTTTTQSNNTGGNWFAFLFGAIFNLMALIDLTFLMEYILQAVAGGIICLFFKIISDVLSPLWLKQKERLKKFTDSRKIKSVRRKKRHEQE
jgi:K+ transporter